MSANPDQNPPRILLVEANSGLRVGLTEWLHQEFSGCTVDSANGVEGAETHIGTSRPDVVLVNVDARQGMGFAALRRIRQIAPATTRVAVSVYPVDYFKLAAAAAGADEFACIVLSDNRLRDLLRRLLCCTESHG